MNELINVDVTVCFKVYNAEMYGGVGSVGYTEAKYENVGSLDAIADRTVEKNRQIMADMLKIALEDVEPITREEYNLALKGPRKMESPSTWVEDGNLIYQIRNLQLDNVEERKEYVY